VIRLHDHCQLHGGYVENALDVGAAHGVGTTPSWAGMSGASGIVIRGVWSHAARGRAYNIISESTVVDCLATGGCIGFHASFSSERNTAGQNTYLINCIAIVAHDGPLRSLYAMYVDWHGYQGHLDWSGIVHMIGCTGLAYSPSPAGSVAVRGLYVEDGNIVTIGSRFAALTGDAARATNVVARGAWVCTDTSRNGLARFLMSQAAGVAEGESVVAYGLYLDSVDLACPSFSARRLRASGAWAEKPLSCDSRPWTAWPGGSVVHMATPISSERIALLDRYAGLLAFDTTNMVLKYCAVEDSTRVWKTVAHQ
jgi:hypothetical protein